MAVLRLFRNSSILENNIVQTDRLGGGDARGDHLRAAGPGDDRLVAGLPLLDHRRRHRDRGHPRRALLGAAAPRADRRLPRSPLSGGAGGRRGAAVGSGSREGAQESTKGLAALVWGSVLSAGFAILTQTKLVASEAATWFRVGSGASGVSLGFSYALMGVGHLVGISVGMAMALGMVLGWGVLLPIRTGIQPMSVGAEEWANAIFRQDIRFFGAGVIGVAAIWTLIKISGPVLGGIRSALAASRARKGGEALALEERDMPIGIVAMGSLAMLAPIAWLLWENIVGGPLEGSALVLIAGALLFVLVIGLMIAAVCGYMAGLIGASNSPVSGIGILSVVAASLMLLALFGRDTPPGTSHALIAYALIVTGIVFGVATISNDNLQDLKTGQLVGATPWRQQVALIIGVVFGSAVVPPVLGLLYAAFGFAGMPGAGPNALAAPQAALISALAQGVLGGNLNWQMIGWGAAAGVALVILDEVMGRLKLLRLPPLGVGIGIYLPMAVILPTVLGSIIGLVYDRWAARRPNPEFAHRMGVLTATGLIVGESLWGVAFAGIVAGATSDAPLDVTGYLKLGPAYAPVALVGGVVLFLGLTWVLYHWTMRTVRATR
jgi:putative OPT family oligopeptide transporter